MPDGGALFQTVADISGRPLPQLRGPRAHLPSPLTHQRAEQESGAGEQKGPRQPHGPGLGCTGRVERAPMAHGEPKTSPRMTACRCVPILLHPPSVAYQTMRRANACGRFRAVAPPPPPPPPPMRPHTPSRQRTHNARSIAPPPPRVRLLTPSHPRPRAPGPPSTPRHPTVGGLRGTGGHTSHGGVPPASSQHRQSERCWCGGQWRAVLVGVGWCPFWICFGIFFSNFSKKMPK